MASTPVPQEKTQSNPRAPRAWAPYAFLTLLYSLTHGLGLLNRGLFWDDWVFWQQNKQLVAEVSRDMGSVWPTDINNWIFYSQFGITFGRVLSFAGLLIATLLIFDIVRRLPKMTDGTAFWVAALFALYPGFTSREALVMTAYSLCVMFFLGAIWLNVRFSPRPKWWVHLIAMALLFLSYHTRSLLVLSGFMPIVFLMADPPKSWRLPDIVKRLAHYTGELAMPFLFFVMTRLWFEPRGLYAGYNQIMAGKINIGQLLWSGIVNTIPFSIVWTPIVPEANGVIVATVLIAPIALLAWRRWSLEQGHEDLWIFDAGVLLLLLAIFPYAMVDKVPTFIAFETRHQLLVPIGWGAIMVALAKAHSRPNRWLKALVAIALTFTAVYFASVHLQSYLGYQREWLKQEALMRAFERTPQIRKSHTLLFIDHTMEWNAGHRSGRQYYEYSGMLTQTFGDSSRMGIERAHYKYIPTAIPGGFKTLENNPYYKLKDWSLHDPDYTVRIENGSLNLGSATTVLRLMILDWTNRPALMKELDKAIELQCLPWSWKPGQPLLFYRIPPQIPVR